MHPIEQLVGNRQNVTDGRSWKCEGDFVGGLTMALPYEIRACRVKHLPPMTITPPTAIMPPTMAQTDGPVYKRILLKISGEGFCHEGGFGIEAGELENIANQCVAVAKMGVQLAIVVGGGNFFRGAELSQRGMDRARADYMGMLGTVMNCLALQDFCEKQGVETRVQTAITMGQVAEPYIPRRAIRHLEKGRVVIFGAGAGMPFFSTDTVAAQRALETKCEVVLMGKNGVDGVYTADPRTDPTATKLDTVSYSEALRRGLRVADATAFALCMENSMPMIVFGMQDEGAIAKVVQGEKIGTYVGSDADQHERRRV